MNAYRINAKEKDKEMDKPTDPMSKQTFDLKLAKHWVFGILAFTAIITSGVVYANVHSDNVKAATKVCQ
jgi:hypothetical protein